MENALEWMEAQKVQSKIIAVLAGNEEVHSFYKRFGFSPLRTILIQDKH